MPLPKRKNPAQAGLFVVTSELRPQAVACGLDAFLAKANDAELSDTALKIKKDIAKAQATA